MDWGNQSDFLHNLTGYTNDRTNVLKTANRPKSNILSKINHVETSPKTYSPYSLLIQLLIPQTGRLNVFLIPYSFKLILYGNTRCMFNSHRQTNQRHPKPKKPFFNQSTNNNSYFAKIYFYS